MDRSIALAAGVVVALLAASSGASASSSPRAARVSTRRRSSTRASGPHGDVTLGPITRVVTTPSGIVTRTTDLTSLTPKEMAAYRQQLSLVGDTDSDLLTDDQSTALESESVERARAGLPGASAAQHERAKRAAVLAKEMLSRKGVPPIPRAPSPPASPMPPAQRAYVSPPTPINLDLARREAAPLAKHIRSRGNAYTRQTLRDFQAHAGITIDGIYGPLAQSALKYFGVPNPPKALFKPAPGSVTTYAPAN